MITGRYPGLRLRRNRKADWIRRLVEESSLSCNDLILPIFLIDGKNKIQSIKTMPGVFRYSIDNLCKIVDKAIFLKIKHILLDNMNLKKMKEACKLIKKNAKIEVSGGINLQNIKKISNIGVNFISVGSITQSAPTVKLCLELKKI